MQVLTQVLSHQRTLDDALSDVPVESRSWVHEITAGTFRFKGRLDWIIDQLSLKKKPSGGVRKALLLAAYQLLNQPQVPQAWIVSETVDAVRKKEGDAAAAFVNAVLRKISDHVESWRKLDWPEGVQASEQAQWASLPEWIWTRLVKDHGLEWARSYSTASLERPTLWIRSRVPQTEAKPGPVAESWELESWRPVHESEDYRMGRLMVQDISSQILVSEFSHEARRLWGSLAGRTVLDLCAAPGGKTTGLAWDGWQVFATDKQAETHTSQDRFRLLQETAARVNAGLGPQDTGRVEVMDRSRVSGLQNLDAVWVDAPCTGSGVLRRHPEIRWIKTEKSLQSLQKEQINLLAEASAKVKSGGLLMFSVCSALRNEELEWVVRSAELHEFKRIREWSLAPHVPPQGDGFSAVLFRRD